MDQVYCFIKRYFLSNSLTSKQLFLVLLLLSSGYLANAIAQQPDCSSDPNNPFSNCGFETGSFEDWEIGSLDTTVFPLQVGIAGVSSSPDLFLSEPSQGVFAVLHNFEGEGPGTIEVGQDITLPPGLNRLQFDYRAGWDLRSFGATQDRTFEVRVEPDGGGSALQTNVILVAEADTFLVDTGLLTTNVDLSAFAGQSVRINFVWDIPEFYSGPGFFQFDNVRTTNEPANTDLEITVNSEPSPVYPGQLLTHTITVTNKGPHNAVGAEVEATFPDEFVDVSWTCEPSHITASCSDSGSGSIFDTVDIPRLQSVTYTVTGRSLYTLTADGQDGFLTNQFSVTVPAATTDPDLSNNQLSNTVTVSLAAIPLLTPWSMLLLTLLLGASAMFLLKIRN